MVRTSLGSRQPLHRQPTDHAAVMRYHVAVCLAVPGRDVPASWQVDAQEAARILHFVGGDAHEVTKALRTVVEGQADDRPALKAASSESRLQRLQSRLNGPRGSLAMTPLPCDPDQRFRRALDHGKTGKVPFVLLTELAHGGIIRSGGLSPPAYSIGTRADQINAGIRTAPVRSLSRNPAIGLTSSARHPQLCRLDIRHSDQPDNAP